MSAEKSHEWLIDSLYPEERDAESDSSQGETLDAQARAERDATRLLLERARQELSAASVAPRAHVSQAILEAARKQAEVHAATAQTGRHVVTQRPASLWSRAQRRGLLQIAAVLCVCLAAGVLVRGFSDDTPSARFERASAGVSNEVHFGDAAPLAAAPQEVAPADFPDVRFNTPAAKDSATLAMQEEQEPPQDQQGQLGGVPKAARGMREYQAAERPKAEPSAPAKKQSAPSLLSSKPSTASRGAEARKQDSKSSWADADEMKPRDAAPRSNTASLDDLAEGEASATIPRQASSGRASSNSIFGSSEGASVAAGGSLSKPAEPPASAPRDDAYGNSMPSASAPARPATQSTPAPMADAVVAEERAESSKKMSKAEASAPSLADVERQYARDNYAKALEDAESYLRSGQGSNQERARAMELKAEALVKLGRGTEAERVYEEIRQKHPDYFKKQNLQQKKKSAPVERQRRSYDFESDSVNSY